MSIRDKTPDSTCMDESDPSLLSVDAALTKIYESIVTLDRKEKVRLPHLLDRILAEDIRSPINVPPFTNSAMDGYAVRGSSLPDEGEKSFKLAGKVFAGAPITSNVNENQCARIMTGGQMPSGTDTVIMQEHVRVEEEHIFIGAGHQPGQNVRHAGEDIKQHETILNTGKRLTPADLGLLASLGIDNAQVRPRLKVAIFSTGDELVPLGTQLQPGQIYDSNRYTLVAMLKHFGAEIIDMGVVKDKLEDVEQAFADAAETADVLITTGGVSVGEADFVKHTLEKIGKVNFWKIAMKPGRPLAYGKIRDCYFFGLPGNPVSTMVTFYQFVLPGMQRLQGETQQLKMTLSLRCITPMRKIPGRMEYQRGIMEYNEQGDLVVRSTGEQGSHILSSMANANCFIILPSESRGVKAGETVQVQPFAGLV